MMKKTSNTVITTKQWLLLFVIVIIAFSVRLYKINSPLADWHSFRQSDTASVARNYTRDGIDLLRPGYDDLSNMQSGKYNPQGYRMVEFPFYNGIFAQLYRWFPYIAVEQWGRIVSAFFSCLLIIALFYLVAKNESLIAAYFSSLIYAIFTFFIFFSRTVLPETTAISLMILSIATLFLYYQSKKNNYRRLIFYFLSLLLVILAL